VVKNEHGCTVNDVVLAICAGAVRRWLIEHEALPSEPLVAQVPVSVRSDDQRGTFGNRIAMLSVPLFTNEADPVRRLALTHDSMLIAKERHRALPAQLLQDARRFIPPAVFSRASRVTFSVSVITDGMGLNITVMSYDGHLDVGIVADREQMRDVWTLIGWLEESPAELAPAVSEAPIAVETPEAEPA